MAESWPHVDMTPLGEDDLADTIRELTDVAPKWRNIGIQLGIRDSQLEAIQGDSPVDCLRQTLSTWLQRNYSVKQFGQPTWVKLVEVINHSAGGGKPFLAKKIAKKHGVSQISAMTDLQQSPPSLLEEAETQMTTPRSSYVTDVSEVDSTLLGSIRGVEGAGEAEFTVSTKGGLFQWKGYGLRCSVPKNSLPTGVEECRINIGVSFSGQFHLPEGSDLFSPVFWITCYKFLKPVTLEIQHCALTEDETALSNLCFVSAKCSQQNLPYTFGVLDGGVFTKHSTYGSIQLNNFSGFGVIGRMGTPRSYCAHLYRTMTPVYECRFYFVITQDIDAMNTDVRKRYGRFTREATLRVTFDHSEITLDIPVPDGLVTKEGWRIIPFTTPTISRKDVDQFKKGRWIPECQLIVQWERKDQKLVRLRHTVTLTGAKAPYNFIHLILNPEEQAQPQHLEKLHSTPELGDLMNIVATKIPEKWREVGIGLGLDSADITRIEADVPTHKSTPCYIAVFTTWKNKGTKEYTWDILLKALRTPSVNASQLASTIEGQL